MTDIKKILTTIQLGKVLSVLVMVFLLSFLTVGNAFLPGSKTATVKKSAGKEKSDNDCSKRGISTEEEKSSSRSISNSLTEEFLHEHDHFMHLYTTTASPRHLYIHPHGFGDDHSTLDCPPPDRA